MQRYRLVLVLLCLALLGAIPFILSLPKPDSGSAQAAVQPQTAVQRQIAAARGTAADNQIRAEIGNTLGTAVEMTQAGKYKQALALVDGLQRIPNKTDHEAWVISQVRQSLMVNAPGHTQDRQTR